MGTITFELKDNSGLDPSKGVVYVAGWINAGATKIGDSAPVMKVLDESGNFTAPTGSTLPFHKLSDISQATLSEATNGNDRLMFVVSTSHPPGLSILSETANDPAGTSYTYHVVQMYTQYPYLDAPGIAPVGPYDFVEFGMDAAFDVSAVDGLCLNLNFTAGGESYGVSNDVSRAEIATAWAAFLANQTAIPNASAYSDLLYDAKLSGSTYSPPMIDDQFFVLSGPNDFLAAITKNYSSATGHPLESYWTDTLRSFFKEGNMLSINTSANPAAPNIYFGTCTLQTPASGGAQVLAYSLTNGSNTYHYFNPLGAEPSSNPNNLQGAQYVFQQAFSNTLTPGIVDGEAKLIQDTIWEALCRGVALDGVEVVCEDAAGNAFSTTAWNDQSKWYGASAVSHLYAKFLHTSDKNGKDSRVPANHSKPIMLGGAAYGFSMDETPLGPYSGTQVPSKTTSNISSGTVTVNVGKWD